MQMHLDFLVDDVDATEARVLAAGATKFDIQPVTRIELGSPRYAKHTVNGLGEQ
jgi:hypothetical protein